MQQQKECLNIKTHQSTRFQLENLFSKFKYVRFCYINFSVSYKNISSSLFNNKLYLSDTLTLTIPDGCYSISDINNSILNTIQSGFYYKLQKNLQNLSYDIYRYSSFTDWQTNIGGTRIVISVIDQYSLNYKLQKRPNLLEAFKIRCNLFVIHENSSTQFKITNELIIPIASQTLSRNHFEPQNIIFDNKLSISSEIQIEFLSLDDQPITFLESDPPQILFIFENN